jgi:hypothetical protein
VCARGRGPSRCPYGRFYLQRRCMRRTRMPIVGGSTGARSVHRFCLSSRFAGPKVVALRAEGALSVPVPSVRAGRVWRASRRSPAAPGRTWHRCCLARWRGCWPEGPHRGPCYGQAATIICLQRCRGPWLLVVRRAAGPVIDKPPVLRLCALVKDQLDRAGLARPSVLETRLLFDWVRVVKCWRRRGFFAKSNACIDFGFAADLQGCSCNCIQLIPPSTYRSSKPLREGASNALSS